MRKGFRSSRGAMRGTIGGTLIFVGVVGFATVAIGVGPFVLSYSLVRPTWPRLGILPSIPLGDRKSTRLNFSHGYISYAVFCLKKKKKNKQRQPHDAIEYTTD